MAISPFAFGSMKIPSPRGLAAAFRRWLDVSAGALKDPCLRSTTAEGCPMADSHGPRPPDTVDDSIDRYIHNELKAREARALAQKSLDDSDLFEELTFQAVVKEALSNPSTAEYLKEPSRGRIIRFAPKVRL